MKGSYLQVIKLPGVVAVFFCILAASASADDLFRSDETLDVFIDAPFKQINKERDKAAVYAGTLSAGEGQFEVELSVRGNKRLDPETCKNAPLWIDFDKKAIKDTLFDHQRHLKLVVLCKRGGTYPDYLRGEYLVYRMYNELSPISYRARWLNVTYQDEKGKQRTEPGFFIERKSRLAKRVGLRTADVARLRYDEIDPRVSTEIALLQYLISNMDYSLVSSADDSCCHNAKPLLSEGVYVPVVYDFDSSGIINAKYAYPAANLGIKKVTTRLYRGYCRHNAQLPAARDRMMSMQASLTSLIQDDPILSDRMKKRMGNFLAKGYDIIMDDEKFQEEVVDSCRGSKRKV